MPAYSRGGITEIAWASQQMRCDVLDAQRG